MQPKCVGESTADLSAQLETPPVFHTSVTSQQDTGGVHTRPAGRNAQRTQVHLPNKEVHSGLDQRKGYEAKFCFL